MSTKYFENDEVSHQITNILMKDATLTSSALGELVGLSPSAANERIRKLKNDGVIKRIVAFVDSGFMNMELGAFIFVLLEGKDHNAAFLEQVTAHPNVLECHHMTGEYSYILKVRIANTKALESFITDFLKTQTAVVKTATQIILSSPKDNSVVVD